MISSNFYRLIKKGESIDDALRGAKLQYLSESPIEAQHPYYWAGFIGVGNCLPLEVIQSPYINWYWTLIITLFILLIGGLYLIKK